MRRLSTRSDAHLHTSDSCDCIAALDLHLTAARLLFKTSQRLMRRNNTPDVRFSDDRQRRDTRVRMVFSRIESLLLPVIIHIVSNDE